MIGHRQIGVLTRAELVVLLREVAPDDGGVLQQEVLAQLAPVPKTGQTTSWATGDDGYHQKGVAWPNPRFTDNGDGTVTDNLTSLMWLQNAGLLGTETWEEALIACNIF